jgi:hypothetical protein
VPIKHRASALTLVAAVISTAQVPVPPRPVPAPPAAAETAPIRIAPDFSPGAKTDEPTKKAYEALFQVRQGRTRVPSDPAFVSRPRTVCGLTVWNIDPDLDPRIRLKPPQPPNVTYTIQKISPPVCQE